MWRNVNGGLHRRVQAVEFGVRHHAHDLQALAHEDMLPQRILVRKVLPDHGFIDQHHAFGILVVVLVEQAALPQRNPHGVEVIRAWPCGNRPAAA